VDAFVGVFLGEGVGLYAIIDSDKSISFSKLFVFASFPRSIVVCIRPILDPDVFGHLEASSCLIQG
jgi:hypothetical protein